MGMGKLTTSQNTKNCPKCETVKPIHLFLYAEKVRSYCNDCERQQTRWRIARPHNRLQTALKDAKRSAAKYGAVDTLTLDDLHYLFALSGGRCAYTGRLMSQPSVDHIIPLSKCGKNTLDNVIIVDLKVNRKKRDSDPSEFLDQNAGFYVTHDIIRLVAARRGVDYAVVYAEFQQAQADYNNELYRKMIGGAGA